MRKVDEKEEGGDGEGEVAHELAIAPIGLQQAIDTIPSPGQKSERRLESVRHVVSAGRL